MKKIVLALAVLGALSSVSLAAGNRSWDLRDTEYFTTSGVPGTLADPVAKTNTRIAPLAIPSAGPTNFQRLTAISIDNAEHARH